VAGCITFIVCALQVYLGKIFKWGIASRGLYQMVRHPQYLLLGVWGIGMAILWPRFIVLASLSLMFVLYYFLALDEERRMLNQYGDSYREYMSSSGMFLPRALERRAGPAVNPISHAATRGYPGLHGHPGDGQRHSPEGNYPGLPAINHCK
jgi:hypothetical protein